MPRSSPEHASDGTPARDSPPAAARATPDVLALASRHPLLESVPAASVQHLVSNCTVHELAEGDVVLQAGSPNHTFYLVLTGELHAILDPTRPADRVSIAAGECFGEMSLIEQMPASATVVAAQRACLLAIPEAVFWSALASEGGLARSLLRALSQRMRRRGELVIKAARERMELEAVQRELALAREVQISMLDDGDSLLKEHPAIDTVAAMIPANAVGGDFYDAFAIDPQRVFVAVGDVAGKGISAAMFMARCLATLRMEVLSGRSHDTLMSRFNCELCEHNARSTFVTLSAGVLDIPRRELTYFSAGHHAAMIVSPSGDVAALPPPGGVVAGALPEAPYSCARYTMRPGDILVMFSDGVTEAHNAAHEFFGETRIADALSAARPQTAAAARAAILEAITAFTGSAPQFDDITVLALRLVGDRQDV